MNPEELFERLINNKISKDEFERLLEGLNDEDVLARYEIYLQKQFEEEIEKHIEEHIEAPGTEKSKLTITKKFEPKKKEGKKRGDYPIAAVIVLFVGLLFSLLFIISQMKLDSGSKQIAKSTIIPDTISKSTPKGRKFRMTLDDGSFVHLNSVSTITYPNKFDEDSREVEIVGEAYFDISHDEQRAFNIKVKDYSVQVLGTAFNIQAYEDENDFSVTVENGKVKVILGEDGSNTATLEKGEKLVFNPETNVTEIVNIDPDVDLSWRKGLLRFDSTPVAKVEKILERWYGINLVIRDKDIYQSSFTGTHQNENLRSVIEALTFGTRTQYEVSGNSIIIKY